MVQNLFFCLLFFSFVFCAGYCNTFIRDTKYETPKGHKNNFVQDSTDLSDISQRGDYFFKKGVKDSALYYDRLLLRASDKINNLKYMGLAASNIAYHKKVEGQIDSSFFYYNLSKNIYKKAGDSLNVGKKLLSLGLLQKNVSDFFGAKETLVESIGYLKQNDDKRYLASVYNELATNNKKLLNLDEAIKYYKKAIEISKNNNDLIIYRNNLSLAYAEQHDYALAEKILNELFSTFSKKDSSNTFARILHNLSYFQWKNGKSEEILGNFLLAKKIRYKNNDLRGLVTSHLDLSEFYYQTNPALAKRHLDSSITISKRIKMPEGEINALQGYIKLATNDIQKRDRLIFLKDSLYKQELKVKTQFAKMKYDDQLEKERLLTLETQAALQATRLAEQRTQKILFLSLSAVLLLVGVSFFIISRQRHKKEKLTEVYNTEKRISEQLHDGMANDVFGLMTEIQKNKTFTDKQLLDKLDKIYTQTRNISHKNSPVQTGDEFINELKSLFESYQGNGLTIIIKGMEAIPWEFMKGHKCIVVYRALNELLVNAEKHSKASLLSFQFTLLKKSIQIAYRDNGAGLKPEVEKGIGLKNTETRIRATGGHFIFEGNKNGGVKATISVPK